MSRGWRAGLAVAGIIAVAAATAEAATIKVDTTADQNGGGPGRCALREAIRAADDDAPFGGCRAGAASGIDEVWVKGKARYPLAPAETLLMGGDMVVRAKGKGRATIDGSGTNAAVIQAQGSANTLKKLVVRDGSGVSGGGVVIGNGAGMQIQNSVITGNSATGNGGGIYVDGTLTLDRSTVRGNTAGVSGGGIHHSGFLLAVTDSTISGNHATSASSDGGGVHSQGATTTVVKNSTISGNDAGFRGGGVFFESTGSLTLNNASVTGNEADVATSSGGAAGGGIYRVSGGFGVSNSIIAGNTGGTAPDCSGQVSSSYSLFGEDAGCSIAFPMGLVLDEPAKLKPLADNGGPTSTHALRKNSPARNAGNMAMPLDGAAGRCEHSDQRGAERPKGPRCDMGAYEG